MSRLRFPKPKREAKVKARIARSTRPRRQRKGKRPSLAREADRLWSLIVKKGGRCEFVGREIGNKPHECKGALQAMHGIPRSYRATRWLPGNGFSGCQAAHWYYTVRKEEWAHYLLNAWGQSVFNELWRLARKMQKPDLPAIVAKLREEAS